MPQKNYWVGGMVMCVFPTIVFFLPGGPLPLPVIIFLSLLIFCGVWAIALGLFKLDEHGAVSSLVGAVVSFGFAGFAFLVAWREKDGWSGGLPFIPHAWNQVIARLLFALGGLIGTLGGISLLRRAIRQRAKKG